MRSRSTLPDRAWWYAILVAWLRRLRPGPAIGSASAV